MEPTFAILGFRVGRIGRCYATAEFFVRLGPLIIPGWPVKALIDGSHTYIKPPRTVDMTDGLRHALADAIVTRLLAEVAPKRAA